MLTIDDLPNVKLTAGGKFRQTQPLTVQNVRRVLKHMEAAVRFNVALAEPTFIVKGEPIPAHASGGVLEDLCDILVMLDINSLGRLEAILAEIARADPYHPMEDWITAVAWDGVDRVGPLIDSVTSCNELWPIYVENWLVQVVEGVCGWRDGVAKKSLPHVLVLVGGQGIGKSHWFKELGGGWLKGEAELHLSSSSGKDHQLAALRFPMVELSELDGIFRKSDVSHMKAFISREGDEIRAPYARKAVLRPRMTSFCGTVNDAEFLNDASGSRRFWPVAVDSIDWSVQLDAQQLWAQAHAMWEENPEFNLNSEEDAKRAAIAVDTHTQISPVQEKVEEYLRLHVGNARFPPRVMNRTEIMDMLFGKRNHWPRDISLVGRVLGDILGKHATIDGKQRSWRIPYNEFAADISTWPDKISLRST